MASSSCWRKALVAMVILPGKCAASFYLQAATEAGRSVARNITHMPDSRLREPAPLRFLRSYARSIGIEEIVVVGIYEKELDRLSKNARVTKFVPLLGEKHTNEAIRHSRKR